MVEVSPTSNPHNNHLKVFVYLNTKESQSRTRISLKDLFSIQEANEDEEFVSKSNLRMGANHEQDFQLMEVEIESYTMNMLYKFV